MRDRYDTNHTGSGAALYANATDLQGSPAEPFVAALARKFDTLRAILADTKSDLVSLTDRVLGPIPRGVGEAPSTNPKISGQADDCLAALDFLISTAADARDEAQRLNNRI